MFLVFHSKLTYQREKVYLLRPICNTTSPEMRGGVAVW